MGVIKKNVVWTTDNFGREYPIYDSRVVVADPSPTPTPSITPTNTPSPTPTPTSSPTPTPSPVASYYSVFICNDPFGPTFVVKYYGTLLVGEAVKVVGDDITCYEVSSTASAPEDYDVSAVFRDCDDCLTS